MSYCPHCGASTNAGASFCAACGTSLPVRPSATPTAPGTVAPPAYAQAMPATQARPVGVTIVGVVMILYGAVVALGVLAAMFFFMFLGAAFDAAFGSAPWFGWLEFAGGIAAAALMVVALFALAFAGLALATGLGTLRGAAWAWVATLIVMALVGLNSLGALASRSGSGILGVLAAVAVFWYYFRPEVKAWFKRA